MNFRRFLFSATTLLFTVLLPTISQAQIEPELPKKKSFNPDYIISDQQLQNYDSMDAEAIQIFLEERGSYLAEYKTKNKQGDTANAAKIIYNAAQKHKINPKYLLVKLQKEQSLITDPNPDQRQLNWATGYGVCDSCTLSDVGVQQHKGFANQVNSAAGIMRWYYNHVSKKGFVKKPDQNYLIDDKQIDPNNYATAFLYTYTPHIQGNKNFWKLWHDWFEQIYPNGSLLKPHSSSDVYLIRNKKKYKFANLPALTSRYNKDKIIEVPSSELARYESGGTLSLPNYSILQSGDKFYLLDDQTIRPFKSRKTIRNMGYHPAEIIQVEQNNLDKFKQGKLIKTDETNPIGQLIQASKSGQYYYLKEGKYQILLDKKIAQINFPNLSVQTKPRKFLDKFDSADPVKLEGGTLFGIKDTGKIYMVEDGKKRHIKDEEVFHQLGLEWEDVTWVNKFVAYNHPTGEPIKFSSKRVKRTNKVKSLNQTKKEVSKKNSPKKSDKHLISELQKIKNKIVKTPDKKTSYKGKKFSTPMETYIITDYKSGKILAGKNINFARPMASLVKPLTAFRLMIEGYNPKATITYQPKLHKVMYNRFNLAKGDKLKSKDIFDAFLIGSYNIAGRMLVENFSKNKEKFINRMNRQLDSWGIKSTKITNVTGEKVSNRTTPANYANLFKKLLNYKLIYDHLSQEKYYFSEVSSTDENKKHSQKNTNKLIRKEHKNFTILAGKTGYLHEAGANLAVLIRDDQTNKKYIIVTMGNPELTNKFKEPKRLIKWTINNF
jgi:hypothetical protein